MVKKKRYYLGDDFDASGMFDTGSSDMVDQGGIYAGSGGAVTYPYGYQPQQQQNYGGGGMIDQGDIYAGTGGAIVYPTGYQPQYQTPVQQPYYPPPVTPTPITPITPTPVVAQGPFSYVVNGQYVNATGYNQANQYVGSPTITLPTNPQQTQCQANGNIWRGGPNPGFGGTCLTQAQVTAQVTQKNNCLRVSGNLWYAMSDGSGNGQCLPRATAKTQCAKMQGVVNGNICQGMLEYF